LEITKSRVHTLRSIMDVPSASTKGTSKRADTGVSNQKPTRRQEHMLDDTTSLESQPPASRILTTAHDLFYRYGIRATGIDRVIAESGVAKKTFYRYYPSKNDLIIAFLEYRHQNWMNWFKGSLAKNGNSLAALTPAMAEWFGSEQYRGCAFINAVVEMANSMPEANKISHDHKSDMTAVIRGLLPASSRSTKADARALAMAVDGAIISVQFGTPSKVALKSLERIVSALNSTRN
jgi:AcrR family transcriptional regulator